MPSRSVMSVLLLGAALSQAAAQTVVYEAGEPGLEPPQLIEDSHVQPVYPEEALQDGVQGTVLLRVVVTADGMVGNVEIFRSPFRGVKNKSSSYNFIEFLEAFLLMTGTKIKSSS